MPEFLIGLIIGGLIVGLAAFGYYQPRINVLVQLIEASEKEKVDVLRGTF